MPKAIAKEDIVVEDVNQEDVVESKDDDQIDETAAAESLKPSNTTKSEGLAQLMKAVAGMSKEDLSAFLTKTLAQVGKESDTVPDNSGKNKGSIAMKPGKTPAPSASTGAVKEDVEGLFEGQDLSEEFKTKTLTIFEAAVNNRLVIEATRIQEEYEEKLEEEVEKQVIEHIDELHEQVEKHLNYVADKWMEQNELALQNNIRNNITESFIEGLKKLFQESYVEVPNDKFDLVAELADELDQAREQLEESKNREIELSRQLHESTIERIFRNVSKDLADTEAEKLSSLAETVEFVDSDDYKTKLEIIKEQYFGDDKSEKQPSTGLINEDTVGSNDVGPEEREVAVDMRPYVAALSRTVKK